jgi:hypothetical protein
MLTIGALSKTLISLFHDVEQCNSLYLQTNRLVSSIRTDFSQAFPSPQQDHHPEAASYHLVFDQLFPSLYDSLSLC